MVRGVGPGLPLHPAGDGRPRLRQGPARPDAVAGVPAPDRTAPRVRVELRRRQPAGPRLRHAVHAHRGRRPRATSTCRSCASRSPGCCSTSRGGSTARTRAGTTCSRAASSASTTSVCSTAASRCRPAGASSRPTAPGWMALFSQNMLELALELLAARRRSTTTSSSSSSSTSSGSPPPSTPSATHPDEMWDDEDGFFYDVLRMPDGSGQRLKVRSLVGLLPLCASTVISAEMLERFPVLTRRIAHLPRAQPRPARQHRRSVPTRRRRSAAALARRRGRSCAGSSTACSTRSGSCRRTASASISRCHLDDPYVFDVGGPAVPRASTSRPSRRRACSAATPTGAVRCGSR